MTPREIIELASSRLKQEYLRAERIPRMTDINKVTAFHIQLFETILKSDSEPSKEHRHLAIAILDKFQPGWNRKAI